jgi:hypothetical protein
MPEKRKKFIHTLQSGDNIATTQFAKHEIIYRHFLQHNGTYIPRQCSLNFTKLGWEPKNLDHLELPFTEEEIKSVIKAAPKEKALGPESFIRMFFSSCWSILKEDTVRAVQHFYMMNQQGLHFLNEAFVVLIPKKDNPMKVSDYRSISFIHSFVKIVSKLMANRLALELNQLISANQTTFIKKRSIQDNCVYVQQVIKGLHKKTIIALFIKLDISKVFDTVN